MLKLKNSLLITFLIMLCNHSKTMNNDDENKLISLFETMSIEKKYNRNASQALLNKIIEKSVDTKEITFFLKNNADPNVQNIDLVWNWALLHYACQNGVPEIVITLLSHKANPNIKNKREQTPLFVACEHNFLNIAQILLEHKANPNIHEVDGGVVQTSSKLVRFGENIFHAITLKGPRQAYNFFTKKIFKKLHKNTVLHYACQDSKKDFIKLLLEHNADPKCKNASDYIPLMYITNSDLIEPFLERACDLPLFIDFENNTILHLAARNNKKTWIEKYLKNFFGNNLELSIRKLMSVLDTGSQQQLYAFLQSLKSIEKKTHIKIPKYLRLIIILMTFRNSVISTLIEQENKSKESPLSIAKKNKCKEIITLFESYRVEKK